MQATIQDVAAAAGVSTTAVSFVINDAHPQVDRIPIETRERILGCAAALGYRGNPIAASLRTGKRLWVGVMTELLPPDRGMWTSAPFFDMSLLTGIQRKLADHGYFTLLGLRRPQNEVQDLDLLASVKIAGIILKSPSERAVRKAEELRAAGIPVVNVFPRSRTDLYPHILDLDNVAAGRMAGELVARIGSRNPAYISIQNDGHALDDRARGFTETIREQLGIEPGFCEVPPTTPLEPSMEILKPFILKNRPDVIVGMDAGSSIKLCAAVDSLELMAPQDLSLIGFDCFVCRNARRQNLSSVGVSWLMAGEQAAQIIVDRVVDGKEITEPRLLPPLFMPGETTPSDLFHESAVADIGSLARSTRTK